MTELAERLRVMVAERLGVEPGEVTLQFLEEWRHAQYRDPRHRFVDESRYGGYVQPGVQLLSLYEIEQLERHAEAVLERL